MNAASLIGIPSFTDAWERGYRIAPAREVVRVERAAVLFADIVGFTCMTEHWSPAQSMEFLRNYQERMATQVIQHHGNVIQYQGDAIVATFGNRCDTRCAAGDALSCAFVMLEMIAEWSGDRQARGEAPFGIGIGVHFGSVGIGQVGVEQHIEHAIAGDTVNVARKLEALTRKVGAFLVASDELIGAIRQDAYGGLEVDKLRSLGRCRIAGRANSISIWSLPREPLKD